MLESVMGADCCILAAEPTAFGFHNFQMVHRLAALLHKPCGVVVNKADGAYAPLEEYCAAHGTPILLRIPYSAKLAELGAAGKTAAEHDEETAKAFRELLAAIQKGAAK